MRCFVRIRRRFLPEIAALLTFGVATATHAGAGVTWLILVALLTATLVIEIGPENTRFSRKRRRSKRPRTRL